MRLRARAYALLLFKRPSLQRGRKPLVWSLSYSGAGRCELGSHFPPHKSLLTYFILGRTTVFIQTHLTDGHCITITAVSERIHCSPSRSYKSYFWVLVCTVLGLHQNSSMRDLNRLQRPSWDFSEFNVFLLLVRVFHLAPISCSSLMLLTALEGETRWLIIPLWGLSILATLCLLLGTIKYLLIFFLTMSSIILNMAECILHGGLNAFNQETLVGYVDTVIWCQYS